MVPTDGAVLRCGAKAPERLKITIKRSRSWALEDVSAASILVLRDDGSTAIWSATHLLAAAGLEVLHAFDAAGLETASPGEVSLTVLMTVPGGTRRADPVRLSLLP
jgi:hypothetical protein